MTQFVASNDTLFLVGKMRIDCYVSDAIYNRNSDKESERLSNPRVLLEKPIGEDIRAILWTDSQTEDYTQEVRFE